MAGIQIDGVNNKIDFDDDQDTSISSATDDTLVIESGGVNIASITSGEFAINEGSGSIDFRVESDDDANMLLVDASGNSIGVGTNSPALANGRGIVVHGGSSVARVELRNDTSGAADSDGMFLTYSGTDAFVGNREAGTIQFWTNGSERARIASDGKISMGFAGTSGSVYHFVRDSGNVEIIHADATNASYAEDVVTFDCNRAATSSYNLLRGTSGGQADSELICDGAGRFAVDGTVNPNGADYAEYFEWKDGNSSSEDRVGYSVVLDGNKIVKATDSDDASKIIGVISGKAAVVGDSAWNKWQLKHLKDDFGRYIYEDYTQTEWTIVQEGKDDIFHSYQTDLIPDGLEVPDDAIVTSKDEDGNNLQRRKVNPDWNKDTVYVPRSDRKEWDTVGLMGKLKLRKGQPTGTNWIKMRDISETIEEWLVR